MSKNKSFSFEEIKMVSKNGIGVSFYPNYKSVTSTFALVFKGGYLSKGRRNISSSIMNKGIPLIIGEHFKNLGVSYIPSCSSLTFYVSFDNENMGKKVSSLFEVLGGLKISKEELDGIKADLLNREVSENERIEKTVVNNMFSSFYPKDDISSLLITDLNRYYKSFINTNNMSCFLIGNPEKEKVMSIVDKYPSSEDEKEEKSEDKVNEDYSSVKKEMLKEDVKDRLSKVTFGIKLPERETLFNEFGASLFGMYTYLPYILLGSFSKFINKAEKKRLIVSSFLSSFVQGGEKTYLVKGVYTSSPDKLISLFNETYKDKVSRFSFSSIKKLVRYQEEMMIFDQESFLRKIISAEENNLSINELLSYEDKVTASSLNKLMGFLSSCPHSIYLMKGIM